MHFTAQTDRIIRVRVIDILRIRVRFSYKSCVSVYVFLRFLLLVLSTISARRGSDRPPFSFAVFRRPRRVRDPFPVSTKSSRSAQFFWPDDNTGGR